jgi:predicted house-cleaning noncanonical NTP pyrophosphatase (MazG superfamily)
MGYKLVRDGQRPWCEANGVSGQWRVSPRPARALLRKLFEEYGEYVETFDRGELFDIRDVLRRLISLRDPSGRLAAAYRKAYGPADEQFINGVQSAPLMRELTRQLSIYVEDDHVHPLFVMQDLLDKLISVTDVHGKFAQKHLAKLGVMGGFDTLTEWAPAPAGANDADE